MSPVEIEEAVEALVEEPFDKNEFPFKFLQAFDTSETALKRLRTGKQNQSDIGGVLKRNNVHLSTCDPGDVDAKLAELRDSEKTTSSKAKFILATDGESVQAENLVNGETLAAPYQELPNHFGFFLQLAGITTVKEIRESSFDIKATGRLNRLYVELLKDNADWATDERRPDMNHFMARLIFCFFAEDTDIFGGEGLFTKTVEQMSSGDADETNTIISEIFRAMDTERADREKEGVPRYANQFPYVNGQLFSGNVEVPRFTKIARSYLIHIGNLDWTKINPDIFGSMIQAVADDEERGSLGMHYTSVPNILKVLNPLFVSDLQNQLDKAGSNERKLLNLRKRIAKIRVFDPACGSGNFLVIAYKAMREIEAEINRRRGEAERRTDIPLTNFRGIELRNFPAEIARLALIIAEYQCDITYRGQKEALAEFLPLDSENWITCHNALRLDWLNVCPPTGSSVKVASDDLFEIPLDQSEIDFENEGGETYICGNPPYLGSQWQTDSQKDDLGRICEGRIRNWRSLDYVAGWLLKAADYGIATKSAAALVTTNSICQGRQVESLWSEILSTGNEITFAHTSFKWSNLASHNAGVTVVIVGISRQPPKNRPLLTEVDGKTVAKVGSNISPYLVHGPSIIVKKIAKPTSALPEMVFGNMPNEGGNLLLTFSEGTAALDEFNVPNEFIRRFVGSQELVRGIERRCIWITDSQGIKAEQNDFLKNIFAQVEEQRSSSGRATTRLLADQPHRFGEVRQSGSETVIAVAAISSENREYLPCDLLPPGTILSNKCYALFDQPIWNLALVASRLHWVWIGTVCVRMRTDFSYSNTLGWNTFPLPYLTEQNKSDLSRCAEDILLAREAHFPATIADLYDPEKMPDDLRRAHDANDEALERIYIGRRFRNDTERLEKLFELYSNMAEGF